MQTITKRFRLIHGYICLGEMLRFDSDFPWHYCQWHPTDAFGPYAEAFEQLRVAADKRSEDYENEASLKAWESACAHIRDLGLSIVEFVEADDDWEITYGEPEEMFILFIDGVSARWRS